MASYPAWPAGLPQTPRRGAWTGGPQDTRAKFQPDAGPPLTRRRTTADAFTFDATFPNLSNTQRAQFEAFWRDDLVGGSLPFVMRDPVTQEAARWLIAGDGSSAWSLVAKGAGWNDLTLRLVRLPGATWFAPYLPAGTLLVPDLVLDFASQVYGIEGQRRTFGDIVTFARAGAANYVDANGVTQSAPANQPRFDHDPSTHAPLGLLMDDTDGDSAAIGPAQWPLGLFSTQGTMLVVLRSQQTSAPTYRNAFAATGAATTDRVDVLVTTAAAQFRVVTGGANQAVNGHGAYTAGARIAIAAAFAPNDFRSSRGGAAVVSDTVGAMPVVDRATLGFAEDRIRIEKVLCWKDALTSAQLQALSA